MQVATNIFNLPATYQSQLLSHSTLSLSSFLVSIWRRESLLARSRARTQRSRRRSDPGGASGPDRLTFLIFLARSLPPDTFSALVTSLTFAWLLSLSLVARKYPATAVDPARNPARAERALAILRLFLLLRQYQCQHQLISHLEVEVNIEVTERSRLSAVVHKNDTGDTLKAASLSLF